jgi:predicted phosphodiesterase
MGDKRTPEGKQRHDDAKQAYTLQRAARTAKRKDVLGRLERLLAEQDIDLAEVGEIQKVRVNEWDVITKGENGKPQSTKARSASIVINPKWSAGPEWPVVQQARPLSVKVAPRKPVALLKGYKTAVVEPDPQFGFLRTSAGELHPTHDPRAIDIAEQLAEAERPDTWVNLGDYLDLAEMSTFRQEPGFVATVQPAIDAGYEHAARQRAVTTGACWIHEGNHDQRAANYLIDNARAAFGLTRAKMPATWPVLSVPYLLRLDELGIDYEDGYPATWRYLNDGLATTHGTDTGPQALQKIADREQVSVISGHTHHAGIVYKTRNTRTHKVETFAHSPGTLARVDGYVPGGGKYRGRRVDGTPTRSWQDWQQGVTIVRYVADNSRASEIEFVRIDEGRAVHRGEVFASKVLLP